MRVVAMSNVSKRRCTYDDEDIDLRRGPWTVEEDTLLIHYIACHGEGRWDMLAKCSGLKRTGKSCRLRWLNYLKPDVKRGNLTLEEQVLILELHSKWGNRWSRIAQHLPGRTDNEIKNYWRTRVQKQARQLKIDANSTRFRDAIRCFWMPRMLQKIEESSRSSSSTIKSQTSSAPPELNQETQASLSQQQPPPPPPPPPQESISMREPTGCFNHQEYYSTNSEKCTTPSISSSFPEMGCYYVDDSRYDMEAFNLDPTMSAVGGFENSLLDCHMAESDWGNGEMADNQWNMDELWQFKQ